MLRLALTLTAILAAQKASAYTPELLLQKSLAKAPELESASARQYLNPFSAVTLGIQHAWGHADGITSRDDQDRIRTRDESSKSNQLSLQVKPKGLAEMGTYRKYEGSLKERTSLERKILASKSAKAAYDLLTRAAQAKEQQALLAEWNTILERSQRLSAISARSDGDAKAVLKAANELDKAKNEMAEISGSIAGVSHTLGQGGLDVAGLETDQILSAQEIQERLTQLTDSPGLSAEEAQSELKLERTRLQHSEAGHSRLIDSIKFSVEKSKDSLLRQRYVPFPNSTVPTPGTFLIQDESRKGLSFNIGVNINLPFLAAGDLDEQRARIKLARQELETQIDTNEAAEHTAALRETLKEKLAAYIGATDGKAAISDSLLRNDPSLAMELQRAGVSRRMLRIKLLAEIRALYVELLFETGRLAGDANTNQLSKTNRRIGA